jgi:Tfp pilus assembly protein FimT
MVSRGLRANRNESGATLTELLVACLLASILLGLVFVAVRQFWFVNSIKGAADELSSQFRQLQQEAVTGDDAVVLGAVLNPGDNEWKVIRFSPNTQAPAPACKFVATRQLTGGFLGAEVTIDKVTFAATSPTSPEWVACKDVTEDPNNPASPKVIKAGSQVAFFYRRGTSTGGSVTLLQTNTAKARVVSISPLTGRVDQDV